MRKLIDDIEVEFVEYKNGYLGFKFRFNGAQYGNFYSGSQARLQSMEQDAYKIVKQVKNDISTKQ
jgi:hypothetical protein